MEQRKQAVLPEERAGQCSEKISSIMDSIGRVIIGKQSVTELILLTLLSSGHVLIEDVPGLGKTSLAKALAQSVDCSFKRIQFTPDVMPSDVTGFSIYNQKSGEFEFRPGSVMSHIVLADEINRASARTQSSLLEAMEEKQVTVDSVTYRLEEPFMVIATQNPVESFGTYPLPEAQMDRFMVRVSMGYPTAEDEARLSSVTESERPEVKVSASAEEILQLRRAAERVFVNPVLSDYIVEIVSATRRHPDILLGSSPRGSIALHRLSRSYALARGRNYVVPEDIKYLAPHILGHRIQLTQEAKMEQKDPQQLIGKILQSVIVPVSERK